MDIGQSLKKLRLSHNLTQAELADRSELSKGFISQVENNLTSPSIATLRDLLECLGSSLPQFFSGREPEKIVFDKAEQFEKTDTETLKGAITWLIPSAQKNQMEPILVTLGPGGQTQEIPPHDGEEVGFVLSGTATLVVGGAAHKLRTGSSFCLHPKEAHVIENRSKRPVTFLWVSTPPSF